MSETDRIRDQLIASAPTHRGLIEERDRVATEWCRENGKDKDNLSIEDVLAIRALPEWQAAGKSG